MTFDLTTWRTHPQLMHLRAAFIHPDVVFERRVNQVSFSYPVAELTYDDPDSGEGVYTDVHEGMLLGVYTAADVLLGWLRIRKAPTSSVLYVSEVSAGDITFADNQKLVVIEDYRLWARIPRMTGDADNPVFYKDYDLAYSNQGDHIPPVAVMGPHRAKTVSPATNTAMLTFDWSDSYRLADGIADTITYLANYQDGTILTGSTTSAQATVRFPVGQRWVKLTVTDANGTTNWGVRAVITTDPATWVPVQLLNLSGSVDNGWECAVKVLADDVSTLLPGTLMILYSEQYYGGVLDTINGYPDCEHILFVGWINDEDLAVEPFQDDLVINARSALGVLQTLPAFTASLEQNLVPTAWHHMVLPNWFRGLLYLMEWHSTLTHVCDIERPTPWGQYIFVAADYTAGTLYDQLKTEAEYGWARLTEDHAGRLYLRRNPHWTTDTERTAGLPLTAHLLSSDWREAVQIQRPAGPRVGWIRGGGFCDTSGDAVLAIAPGDSPGQGAGQSELNGMWVMDQAELNDRLGRYYDGQNLRTPRLQITLNHQGLPFDPAWQELVEFTLDDETNRRLLGYTQAQFVLTDYSVSHDGERGVTTEVLTLEELAGGNAATTEVIPPADPYTPPDIPLDGWDVPDPPPVTGGSGLKNALLAVNRYYDLSGDQRHGLLVTTDVSDPLWEPVMNGLPLVYGDTPTFCPEIRRAYVDTHNPDNAYVFLHNTAISLAHGAVYYIEGWRTGGTWTALLTWQDIVDSGLTGITTASECWMSDALISFCQPGLVYLMVTPGVNEKATVIRVAGYGADVQYSPRMRHQDPFGGYMNQQASLALGHDDPDQVWVLGRYVGAQYLWSAVWGDFPLTEGGEWLSDYLLSSWNQLHFILNPYYTLSGAQNLDTQLFYVQPYKSDETVYINKSELGGVGGFTPWTADKAVPSSGERDYFDVPGKANMRAWWRYNEYLKVLKTTDPAVITSYAIPGFASGGFTLGWPLTPGQYYAAQWAVAATVDPILKMTTNADGGVWTDLTSNLWDLLNVPCYHAADAADVKSVCPHWTET